MTKQRELVLKIVRESEKHLTADEIFILARESMPSLALGTVYRNLKLLVEAHEVSKICVADEPDRYDKNIAVHGHLVCEKCGKVEDIFVPNLLATIKKAAQGKVIINYSLTVSFLCRECSKNIEN